MTLLEDVQAVGIAFVSLDEGIDCTTAACNSTFSNQSVRFVRVLLDVPIRRATCDPTVRQVLLFDLLEMLAQAVRFDNPQPPSGIVDLASLNEERQGSLQQVAVKSRQPYDDNAKVLGRSIVQGIGEIQVEGDEAPLVGTTDVDNALVGRGAQVLVSGGCDIEVMRPEELGAHRAKVLIQLDSHAAPLPVTMTCSRAISAP